MTKNRANSGQFSVIAALLVSVILVTAVISSYTLVRHAPLQESPKVLTVIEEMNMDIKRILDFTIGYYGSILRVTGNSTYARGLAKSYLESGLVNIARAHPDWNPSFNIDFDDMVLSTRWFMPHSYSTGQITVTYSITNLGIEDITYETSSALTVTISDTIDGKAVLNVTRDNSEPELGLTKENFLFYKYQDENSTWKLINPPDVIIASNGTYTVTLPSGIDPEAYSVQVEDNRGITVSAFYTQESADSSSGIPRYTYRFDWGDPEIVQIYNSTNTDTFVIELLQNGTLRWLGKPLDLIPNGKPIPPVSIKAIRVNATVGIESHEIPFQVEDWELNYKVPLGLACNESIFSNNNMIVFLVNNSVSEVTVWWDGNDTAIQTPYGWKNFFFNDNKTTWTLDNGEIRLNVHNFWINSVNGPVSSRTDFMRINYPDGQPHYGDEVSLVIYNGVVRDIIQQEPEYIDGVSNCPDFYAQVYLTLPANTPYYTYTARTIFLGTSQSRSIYNFSVIQLSDIFGSPLTEDGTDGVYPLTSSSTGIFYDGYPTGGEHRWSQIVSGNSGAGIMFTDRDNQNLYVFDDSNHRGALNVQNDRIEVNPVEEDLDSISFTDARDLTWHGAVVTFDGEPIYPTSGYNGLWVMVEHPPTVTVN